MLKKLNHALWPAATGLLLALGLVLPALCALDFPAYASAVRACLLTAVCAALWGMGGAYTAAGLAVAQERPRIFSPADALRALAECWAPRYRFLAA